MTNDDNFDVNLVKNANILNDIDNSEQEQNILKCILRKYVRIMDCIKNWYNKLERNDKIAIVIIIILLLLGGRLIFDNISSSIKIAQTQHRRRPENPTIRKIKDVVLLSVRGLLYYYNFINNGDDIDNYSSKPSSSAPNRTPNKIFVPYK